MTDIFVDEEGLELNDPPRLAWVRVQDAVGLIWRDNPKRHDMQSLTTSIERYGFQEPAKFDAKLHRVGQQVDDDPLGAIKSGNGRIEAVAWLESQGKELPRGLALNASGEWMLPMLVGTDARSGAVAQAYAVDANNLTLAGGDFDGFDMARLWGPEYVDLLSGLDELPVSVDAEMLGVLSSLSDLAEDWSDLDQELEDLEGSEEVDVKITVPAMHEEAVIDWLANGESKTAPGMGKGVLRHCGLL